MDEKQADTPAQIGITGAANLGLAVRIAISMTFVLGTMLAGAAFLLEQRQAHTTAAAAATATAEPAPIATRADTAAGEAAFVAHWLRALDRAKKTGDTRPLTTLGRCGACIPSVERLEDLYAGDGRVEGGRLTVRGTSTIRHTAGRAALVRTDYDRAAARKYRADGSMRALPATRLAFVFSLDRSASGWRVAAIQPTRSAER